MRADRLKPVMMLILFCLLFIVSCKKKITETNQEPSPFYIYNLGVTFGLYNPATGRAGDFIFLASENKVFLEFGVEVGNSQGGTKQLPTFEYRLDKEAYVFAIAPCRVNRFIYQQETQDWEIGTESTVNHDWEIGYDHVKNPRVGMGDILAPGDTLGNPGSWSGLLGRFEIMINNKPEGRSYCPFCCFYPDSAEVYKIKVELHMQDWETFKHDTSLFDQSAMVHPGCLMESMVTY